ncbi:hypothetical protein WJX72_012006 [[Myrmecia] bisecta]|uniref:General transcription and DNA repair factor IIH subunit TFB5 n=1 Tax=[Myrmecia] bisecta TaxID=41462 RepID=A0AAW1PZJ4_9CHLO
MHGVLLECDIPTKEYILRLNEDQPASRKFVIEELDDIRLFVSTEFPGGSKVLEWLQRQLTEFHDQNTYQPPRRDA